MQEETPHHKHDCDDCIFLGRFNCHDLYFCKQGGKGFNDTLIARYGSEGEAYISGMMIAAHVPGGRFELEVAYFMAQQRGLIQ